MDQEKKNKFPWETLETITIMNPKETIAYLLYLCSIEKRYRKGMDCVISSYVRREKKKEESTKCFQM